MTIPAEVQPSNVLPPGEPQNTTRRRPIDPLAGRLLAVAVVAYGALMMTVDSVVAERCLVGFPGRKCPMSMPALVVLLHVLIPLGVGYSIAWRDAVAAPATLACVIGVAIQVGLGMTLLHTREEVGSDGVALAFLLNLVVFPAVATVVLLVLRGPTPGIVAALTLIAAGVGALGAMGIVAYATLANGEWIESLIVLAGQRGGFLAGIGALTGASLGAGLYRAISAVRSRHVAADTPRPTAARS
ncbi:MAG: hypothetical protein WD004_06340 [Actinomycetota bacterium]